MLDWITLTVVARRHERVAHPLADPLEGAEWQGHQWMARLIGTILRGRRR
ncbi:hypothetical protein [Martelella limonii]|nr:hypothetical protein [Martelella limonii]